MMRAPKITLILLFVLTVFVSGCSTPPKAEIIPTSIVADRSLINVLERGKLIVASDAPYGVLEFYDEDGELVGMEVDLAKEIAFQLGVDLEFIDYDWDDIFPHVQSGQVDIAITGMTITADRSMDMLFSIPYLNAGQVIIVRQDEEEITSLKNLLRDKIIGVQKETTGMEEMLKYVDRSFLVEYEGFGVPDNDPTGGILNDLENGKIDAIVADYTGAVDFVKQHPFLKIAGEPFTDEFYGIPTKLGNHALMDKINDILRNMKETDQLKDLVDKWME